MGRLPIAINLVVLWGILGGFSSTWAFLEAKRYRKKGFRDKEERKWEKGRIFHCLREKKKNSYSPVT